MIGLTSYRDYVASPKNGRSSKYESLRQYIYDLEELLGEPIAGVPTTMIGKGGSYEEYDRLLLFEHPTSFLQPTAGGFTTPNIGMHLVQLEKLIAYDKEVLSCNFEGVDYEHWIKTLNSRRLHPNTRDYNIPSDSTLKKFFERVLRVSLTESLAKLRESRTDLAIGDSHTVMLWRPQRTVEALYGRTLHRALKEGLDSLVHPGREKVTFCFGNIDLRHHLARQDDPIAATEELAKEYVRQTDELNCETAICELLPVIQPDRLVIKSYHYKKEPHYGSTDLRCELRRVFSKTLRANSHNTQVLRVPSVVIGEDELMREEAIERTKGGIHIGPSHYEMAAIRQTTIPENAWLP